MKYFTTQWWSSGCKDESVIPKYKKHLSDIKHLLPQKLVALESDFTLHDAQVKKIISDISNRTVTIILLGWDRNLESRLGYTLVFSGVDRFVQTLPQEEYVESELGDLGYWEIQATEDYVEISMLFASDAEFSITFKGFDFSVQDASVLPSEQSD